MIPDPGTLRTSTANITALKAAGINVAEIDVGWDSYETADGTFSSAYATSISTQVSAFTSAGMKVVLGFSFHNTPTWVMALANSRYVNQFGNTAGQANLVFNQVIRDKAAAAISAFHTAVGLNNFYAVRITGGGDAECLFPDEFADGLNGNGYWAYDANAVGSAANRPTTIPVNPFPTWNPGDVTPLTVAQVRTWLEWYIDALVDQINWQIQTYKTLGYTGKFHILTPGLGSMPNDYESAIAAFLDGSFGNFTLGRGGAWHKVYEFLPDRANVTAYVSSMADRSGTPADNVTQPTDRTVGINDAQINSWSAARWISYLADTYGMQKSGENPGRPGTLSYYGLRMMQAFAEQAQAANMESALWAFDTNLFDGISQVTVDDLGNLAAGHVNQQARPDADITTTGWSTAPLFSKLNDLSDTTVITATLV